MNTGRDHINSMLNSYFEGNLTDGETENLFRLLKESSFNPEELILGELPVISTGKISFPHKRTLHKSYSDISAAQFETLCIAEIEGDLSPSQSEEVIGVLESDPEKNKVYNSFKKLRLEPGIVVYRSKNRLKKLTYAGRLARMSVITLSMAATIAIVVIAFNFLNSSTEETLQTGIVAESVNIEGPLAEPVVVITKEIQALVKSTAPLTASVNQEPISAIVNSGQQSTGNPEQSNFIIAERMTMPEPVLLASGPSITNPEVNADKLADVFLATPAPYETPSLRKNIASGFREKILGEKDPVNTPLKGYEIADAGINGINRLFGWGMDLEAKKEPTGEVSSLAFNSRWVKIQTPVKKGDPGQQ